MAINNCVLMGRLTSDPELRYTTTNKAVISFTLAIDRGKGEDADFIPCVAWEKKAEFISRYFSKGRMIALAGQMRSRKYRDKSGQNRTALECVVSSVSFTGEHKMDDSEFTDFSAPKADGSDFDYTGFDDTPFLEG